MRNVRQTDDKVAEIRKEITAIQKQRDTVMVEYHIISTNYYSKLAAKLIQSQGIDVIGLHFQIPFCPDKRERLSRLGLKIEYIDISQDFLKIIQNPRYGFGSNINPCIDCKIFMLQKAKELMPKYEAKFVITGEVLGQRPMSQNSQTLKIIEKDSGLEEFLLRPLCAKLMPETIPEKEGWVKREKLGDFSGRGRKSQMALAKELGITNYAQPAGGCLLTDPEFSRRLKELMQHNALTLGNVELLKLGRHFRLSPATKLIVGRNQKEDEALLSLAKPEDYIFMPPEEVAGPTSLGKGNFDGKLIELSCALTLRYCNLKKTPAEEIVYRKVSESENKVLRISPIKEEQLISLKIA